MRGFAAHGYPGYIMPVHLIFNKSEPPFGFHKPHIPNLWIFGMYSVLHLRFPSGSGRQQSPLRRPMQSVPFPLGDFRCSISSTGAYCLLAHPTEFCT
jgi:hypothetical protein